MEDFTVIKCICIILTIVLIASAGCTSYEKGGGSAPVTAAVTILPQQEFVQRVGGERVSTIVMIPPGASPATYSPVPEEVKAISQADIYFKVGTPLPFEDVYLDRLIAENQEMAVINCSEKIVVIDNDPHVWTIPKNAILMIGEITEGLCTVDPKNATYYRTNAEAYIDELNDLDTDLNDILNHVGRKTFIVYHPAWNYFAREYGLMQIAIEKDGKEPGSRELAEIINTAKRDNLTEVYVSPQMNTEPARFIAGQIGGRLVYADPLAKDYIPGLEQFAISVSGNER